MSVSEPQLDLNMLFHQLDLGSLHKSKAALEDFCKRDPLPICGICTKTPEKCTRDSQGSHRCANCIRRKEACSWKSDIAVIEILRRYPQVDPGQARARYNKWVEDSRRKRPVHEAERPPPGHESEGGEEISTKRKRPRAPYRSWATEEIPVASSNTPVPDVNQSGSPVPQTRIMTLDDLNAFNYATLKREKEAAEEARNQMAQSLDVALRRIINLEEDNRNLRAELAAWRNKS